MTASARNSRILVVDDEPNARRVLQAILEGEGYQVELAYDFDSAVAKLGAIDCDAVITDMKMPGKGGMEVFEHVKDNHPDVPVVFLTAFGSVEAAVEAMTRGAFYYFIKPPDYPNLKGILARAVEQRRLKRELDSLRRKLAESQALPELIGEHSEIRKIADLIEAVKDSDSAVLVMGETGTGKEIISRRIHFTGCRRDKPFVAVNCAAIPSNLLESELFGWEKGAFTGASARRVGKFEEAAGGTLFLDEIGEMDPAVQAKLLRVLQDKEVERLGSNKKIKVDFRLVTSTNRNLAREVETGNFREDLYYRLNVVQITMPALRERREDVPFLVKTFLRECCAKEGKVLDISGEALRALCRYAWPGNIRQLKNTIERMVVLGQGREIKVGDLPDQILAPESPQASLTTQGHNLKDLQEIAVRDALDKAKGNKSKAAQMLGISRKALYKRLRDFGVTPGDG